MSDSDAAFEKWDDEHLSEWAGNGYLGRKAAFEAGRAYEEGRRWREAAEQRGVNGGNRYLIQFTPSAPVIKDDKGIPF